MQSGTRVLEHPDPCIRRSHLHTQRLLPRNASSLYFLSGFLYRGEREWITCFCNTALSMERENSVQGVFLLPCGARRFIYMRAPPAAGGLSGQADFDRHIVRRLIRICEKMVPPENTPDLGKFRKPAVRRQNSAPGTKKHRGRAFYAGGAKRRLARRGARCEYIAWFAGAEKRNSRVHRI